MGEILQNTRSATSESYLLFDLDGYIIECNDAAQKCYGLKKNQQEVISFKNFLFDNEEFDMIQNKLLDGEKSISFDTQRIIDNAEVIHVIAKYTPEKDISGKLIGISCRERKLKWTSPIQLSHHSANDILMVTDEHGNIKLGKEKKLLALMELFPNPMIIMGKNGVIQLVNAQTEKLFEYKREEILKKKIEMLISAAFIYPYQEYKNQFFKSTPEITDKGIELYGRKKNGKEFYMEIILNRFEMGRGVLVSATIKDISERKKADEKFRNLLESAPDAVLIVNEKGDIQLVNAQTEKMFEYKRDEILGNKVQMLMPERLRTLLPDFRKRLFEFPSNTHKRIGVELYGMKKSGKEFPVEISISPLVTEEGTLLTAAIRDITERKKADEKFRNLLELAPDAVIIVNERGDIQLINAQAEKMFDYLREEVLGKPVEFLMPDRYSKIHLYHRTKLIKGSKARSRSEGIELFGKKKDGKEFPIEVNLSPLDTEDGLLVSVSIRDISERKYIKELELKNRELEQFAYIASHDLQEPLDTISSFILLLEDEYVDKMESGVAQYLGYIRESTARLRTLITGLLEYSRIGNKSNFGEVDCNKAVQDVLADMDAAIKKNNAEITVGDLPVVKGFPVEMRQLFQNLISNAIKFQQKGKTPKISISAVKENKNWLFTVEDNGIGIDEKYKERVFVIFQRLHSNYEYKGTGIGLSQCKKIVELHNGKIWIDSILSIGSKFHFTIPEIE